MSTQRLIANVLVFKYLFFQFSHFVPRSLKNFLEFLVIIIRPRSQARDEPKFRNSCSSTSQKTHVDVFFKDVKRKKESMTLSLLKNRTKSRHWFLFIPLCQIDSSSLDDLDEIVENRDPFHLFYSTYIRKKTLKYIKSGSPDIFQWLPVTMTVATDGAGIAPLHH